MFHEAVGPDIHHLVVIVQNSRERGWVSQHTNATRERVGNAHTAAFRFLALGCMGAEFTLPAKDAEPALPSLNLKRRLGPTRPGDNNVFTQLDSGQRLDVSDGIITFGFFDARHMVGINNNPHLGEGRGYAIAMSRAGSAPP